MSEDARAQFRQLPEPVRPEQAVETVDTRQLPEPDPGADQERVLRTAG